MSKYNITLRILHWCLGLLLIILLCLGVYMTELDSSSYKLSLYRVHKAIGLTVLIVVIFRIIVRVFSTVPPYATSISNNNIFIAKLVHYLLYVAIFIVPFSGYIMSCASGKGASWFLGINFPVIISYDLGIAAFANKVHMLSNIFLVILIILHIAGFFKHYFVDKHNLIHRIWK